MDTFQGFTPEVHEFYRNLARNNNREWFARHREEYRRDVFEPARKLAATLAPMLRELDPRIIDEPGRIVSRIHRDTRFSHDKSPYRCRTFLAFRRYVRRWSETAVFFFQVEQSRYVFGMGIYGAPPAMMRRFRETIDREPDAFAAVIEPIRRARSLQLVSEKYKRRFEQSLPQSLAAMIEPWYQSKSIAVMGSRDPDKTLYSGKLVDVLLGRFVVMKPLYDFLWRITEER